MDFKLISHCSYHLAHLEELRQRALPSPSVLLGRLLLPNMTITHLSMVIIDAIHIRGHFRITMHKRRWSSSL